MDNKLVFEPTEGSFRIIDHGKPVPIVVDPAVDQSVRIAVDTFADDVERISGRRPAVLATSDTPDQSAIVVRIATENDESPLFGKWEAFQIRMDSDCKNLIVTGSDKVRALRETERAAS